MSLHPTAAALAALLLLLAAPGCALIEGEDHARDELRETLERPGPRADPRDLAPQRAPIDATTAAAPGTATAAIEEPLTLEEALNLAVATSERIRAAGEDLHQAHLLRIQALSQVLPAIAFRQSYTRFEDDLPDTGGGGGGGGFFNVEQRTTGIEARYPFFRLGNYLAVAQAASVIQAADARARAERLFVEQATVQIFYEALTVERQVETFRAALARDRERLREVQGRADAGLARRTEVLFVETDLAQTRASLVNAEESLAGARERLALLVGRPLRGAIVEPSPPPDVDPVRLASAPLPELIDEAFSRRPDLQALRAQVEVEEGGRLVALGGFAPTLDVGATWYFHRDGAFENVDWDVAVDLVFPIFEGFLTSARVREAESRKRRADLLLRSEGRQVAAAVASAYRALRAAAGTLEASEEALRAADENFRLLEAEYRVGLASNLELVTAQQSLTEARLVYETVRLDRQRLARELWFLIGGRR